MTMNPTETAAAMAIVRAAIDYVEEYEPLLEAIRAESSFAQRDGNRQRVALLDAVEAWNQLTRQPKVQVILFRRSGKYYTEEEWRIPEGAIGPYDMDKSPDFRRIDGGPVLVESQEPWGYPHLFPGQQPDPVDVDWRSKQAA